MARDFAVEASFEVDRNELKGELRELRQEADRTERSVDELGRESQQAGRKIDRMGRESRQARREIDGLNREGTQAARTMQLMGRAIAAVGIGFLAREALRMTDSMKNMRSQIRIVTDSQEELNAAFAGSLEVANATRSALDSTVTLYARLARSTEQLGVEQSELLSITQTINEAFVVSGATAQEASNAIVQLSQGLASGQLRGEEFRSVAEQAPRLLQAMAEALDKTRGELMEMAFAGELTTDVIVQALGSQSQAARRIHDDFQDVELTVSQALTVTTNNLTVFVDHMDDASGASSGLVSAINLVSGALELLNDQLERNNTLLEDLQIATDGQASWYDRLKAAADSSLTSIFNQAEILPSLITLFQQLTAETMSAADAQRELAAASGGVVQTLGPMQSLADVIGGMVAPALGEMHAGLLEIQEQRMESQIGALMDRLIDATPIIGQTGSAAREAAGDFLGLGEAIRGATEDAQDYVEAVQDQISELESATRTEREQIEITRRERIQAIEEARELGIRSAEELADLRRRVDEEYLRERRELEESMYIDLAELQDEIARNTLEGIQGAITDFYATIISEGRVSFESLWGAFEDLAIRAISNILGAITTNLFAQLLNQATGGALGSLLGGSLGSVGGNLGGGLASLFGGAGTTAAGGATATALGSSGGTIVGTSLGSGQVVGGTVVASGGAFSGAGVGGISGATVTGGSAGAGLGGGTAASSQSALIGAAGLAIPFVAGTLIKELGIGPFGGTPEYAKALRDIERSGFAGLGPLGGQVGAGEEFSFFGGPNAGFAAEFARGEGLHAVGAGLPEQGIAAFRGVQLEELIEVLEKAEARFEQVKAAGVEAFGEIGTALNDGVIDRSEAAVLGLENIGEAYVHPRTGAIELKEITTAQFAAISAAINAGELRLKALQNTSLLTASELQVLGNIGVDALSAVTSEANGTADAIRGIPGEKTIVIRTQHVSSGGGPDPRIEQRGRAGGGIEHHPTTTRIAELGPEAVVDVKGGHIPVELRGDSLRRTGGSSDQQLRELRRMRESVDDLVMAIRFREAG